mgnify:CR=1 FL=1
MLYPLSYGENPMYPRACDFQVVRKDDNAGLGVLSHRHFYAGELLAIMHGKIVTEIRQHTLQIEPGKHMLDKYFAGYFLHSCEPNISLDMLSNTVTSLKEIKPGQFLYMDYAQTESVLFKQFFCGCDSTKCRGWITGKDESPVALLAAPDVDATKIG